MIIPTMNAPWFRKSFKSDHKKLLMIIIPSANEVRGGGGIGITVCPSGCADSFPASNFRLV